MMLCYNDLLHILNQRLINSCIGRKDGRTHMRNKVNNKIAGKMIAMLLTLVMILGTFSVAVFAEEASSGDAKFSVAADNTDSAGTATEATKETEKTEKAEAAEPAEVPEKTEEAAGPAEAPEKTEEAAEPAEAPEKAEETAVPEEVPEKAEEPEDGSGDEPAAEAAEPDGDEPSEDENQTLEAVTATPESAPASETPADDKDKEEASYEVKIVSNAITAKVNGAAISSGDKVKADETVSLSTTAAAGTYEFRVNGSSIQGDSFTMPEAPVSIDIAYKVTLKPGDIPDGVTVTFNAGSGNTTYKFPDEMSFYLVAGTELVVQIVEGLTSEFQQGESPAGSVKQLKLVFTQNNTETFRISLNNSEIMSNTQSGRTNTSAVFRMPAAPVDAVFRIANRVKAVPAESPYNRGSCTINNLTDNTSEYGDHFGLPGDKFSVNYEAGYYESVDITASDKAGNQIPVRGGQFTMPSSLVNLKILYHHKPLSVNVVNLKPDRGSIYVSKSQYRPGETVVVHFKANRGFKFNTNTLMYTYTLNGKTNVEKITKGSDGRYSFIMPFYPVDIRGVFVAQETYESASDRSLYVDYSDEDEAEAAAEEEKAEEKEDETPQDAIDVTPIVARVISETVLTATVDTVTITH